MSQKSIAEIIIRVGVVSICGLLFMNRWMRHRQGMKEMPLLQKLFWADRIKALKTLKSNTKGINFQTYLQQPIAEGKKHGYRTQLNSFKSQNIRYFQILTKLKLKGFLSCTARIAADPFGLNVKGAN